MAKTRDGVKLTHILNVANQVGASIRNGTNHPYILSYTNLRACPVAESSDARKMIAPWIAKMTGKKAYEVYSALRRGYW